MNFGTSYSFSERRSSTLMHAVRMYVSKYRLNDNGSGMSYNNRKQTNENESKSRNMKHAVISNVWRFQKSQYQERSLSFLEVIQFKETFHQVLNQYLERLETQATNNDFFR